MNAKTSNGGTPLWWAKRSLKFGHEAIRYLEESGALDEGDEEQGNTKRNFGIVCKQCSLQRNFMIVVSVLVSVQF